MYLYFDSNGTLKEQINDVALRQGNANINKLYVYWEKSVNNQSITGLWARYKADDGSYYPSSSTYQETNTTINAQIPYDKNRDLKYFNYWTTYKFYVIDIPELVLGVSGAWLGSLWFVENDSITTLSEIAFYVESSTLSVKADENINVAQWNELMLLVSSFKAQQDENTSAIAGKQDILTFDDTPTEASYNPVTSRGIFWALVNKQDRITDTNIPSSIYDLLGNELADKQDKLYLHTIRLDWTSELYGAEDLMFSIYTSSPTPIATSLGFMRLGLMMMGYRYIPISNINWNYIDLYGDGTQIKLVCADSDFVLTSAGYNEYIYEVE